MKDIKTKQEIEAMHEMAVAACDNPKYHGQTYEDGVAAALEWVLGEVPDNESIL